MADLIDEIIDREGNDKQTNDPSDTGGRTKFGISEAANPDAWRHGPPTREAARAIYQARYIDEPGFAAIDFVPLRNQVIDYGVNAGPKVPIFALQHILGLTRDGHLGPLTRAAINAADGPVLNNKLVAHRELFYRALAKTHYDDRKFLKGWLARARKFFLP